MKERTASMTAQDMAGFRAMEMVRPKQDRVCEDPFAEHFLTGQWVNRIKKPIQRKLFLWITNMINPGAANTVPARVRFIDECIKTCVKEGLEQLVILGAGYDCRAYRMEELKDKIKIFEVDHPATQEQKKSILKTLVEDIPDHVIFVPYQLEEKGFAKKLFEKGYNKDKKSLYILEGLIMYLEPEAVKKLFSFISQNSGPESSMVFDFLPPGVEDGSINNRGGRNMHKWAQRKGEPFKFGIDKTDLTQFLSETGFHNANIIEAKQCRDKYFKGTSKSRNVSPLFSFANAIVRP